MRRWIVILLFLVACGSDTASQLKQLLILPEDLPPHLGIGPFETRPVTLYRQSPPSQGEVFRSYMDGRYSSGLVGILLYDAPDDRQKAYDNIIDDMGREDAKPLNDIGEQATMTDFPSEHYAEIVFIRCRAVVNIRFPGDGSDAIKHVRRLDTRIAPIVCTQ